MRVPGLNIEDTLKRCFHFNPCIAVHELRMRMRGARPFVVLFFYALLAAATVLITLAVISLQSSYYYGTPDRDPSPGRTAFAALAFSQLALILFVMPAYAAGAITMEREKHTLEMLRGTLLSPADVVTGKLVVVLAFGVLLLLTSAPVAAWCMMLRGISPAEVALTYSSLLIIALWVATLGMLFSVLLKRTTAAIVATYITIVVWCGVPPLLSALAENLAGGWSYVYANLLTLSFLVMTVGTVFGWLVFLICRMYAARGSTRSATRAGTLVSALIACASVTLVFGLLLVPLFEAGLTGSGSRAMLVAAPYGGPVLILFAEDFVASRSRMTVPETQLIACAVTGGIYLIIAIFFWIRSIVLFEERKWAV